MDRSKIAEALEETATLLELKGENAFKVRAYNQAARAITTLEEDPVALVRDGRIEKVKGIGKSIGADISELVETGKMSLLEDLREIFPDELTDMLAIQGLGPKKLKTLYDELGIGNIGELEYACRENRLVALKGFGKKTQDNILNGIQELKKYRSRHLWADIESAAMQLKSALADCPAVGSVETAGSFRRFRETVKDLDFVCASDAPEKVADYVKNLDIVERMDAAGETKLTFRLTSGISVDLRIVPEQAFPFALHHFTGSREHNTRMRQRAKGRGLKMNEYGLFDENEKSRQADDEEGVFKLLDLTFIPPELREDMGEIEAAEKDELPGLIEFGDLKGIFHVHSTYSDGTQSIKELVVQAREAGYEYLGLSDHSRSASYAGGLTEDGLKKQLEEIQAVREKYSDFILFWGIESDILPDGSLDYNDAILDGFDFVIASVHSNFKMPEKDMTRRIIEAVRHPKTTILGHPTGRLLLAREAYDVDLRQVLEAAGESGTAVEINSNPHRLDLDWRQLKLARSLGIRLAVCPDAHAAEGFDDCRFGIMTARKGWLTAADVLNTMSGADLKKYLKKPKPERVREK